MFEEFRRVYERYDLEEIVEAQ
jgi:hypothetical protein